MIERKPSTTAYSVLTVENTGAAGATNFARFSRRRTTSCRPHPYAAAKTIAPASTSPDGMRYSTSIAAVFRLPGAHPAAPRGQRRRAPPRGARVRRRAGEEVGNVLDEKYTGPRAGYGSAGRE